MKTEYLPPSTDLPAGHLVAPSTERKGAEFADWSVSLSNRYTDAVIAAGGLPQIFPATTRRRSHRRGGAALRRRAADRRG